MVFATLLLSVFPPIFCKYFPPNREYVSIPSISTIHRTSSTIISRVVEQDVKCTYYENLRCLAPSRWYFAYIPLARSGDDPNHPETSTRSTLASIFDGSLSKVWKLRNFIPAIEKFKDKIHRNPITF